MPDIAPLSNGTEQEILKDTSLQLNEYHDALVVFSTIKEVAPGKALYDFPITLLLNDTWGTVFLHVDSRIKWDSRGMIFPEKSCFGLIDTQRWAWIIPRHREGLAPDRIKMLVDHFAISIDRDLAEDVQAFGTSEWLAGFRSRSFTIGMGVE